MASVGLVTCAALPDGWEDDRLLAEELRRRGAEAPFVVWDDPGVDWSSFDRVVIRSTWDYTHRREEFLDWARPLDGRLDNSAAVVEWNSDKRYLADLESAGVPTVPTRFVAAGDPVPELEGEVVVKPTVSAGARDTGRFGPAHGQQARALIERLRSRGRTAIVQPYLQSVDRDGETAIVAVDGAESHVLRKRGVLGPDEEAPIREQGVRAAEAMFDPDLVGPGTADDGERRLAGLVAQELERRFGAAQLYARVDMLRGEDGEPVLLELEVVEPSLYLATSPGSERRLADAVLRRAAG